LGGGAQPDGRPAAPAEDKSKELLERVAKNLEAAEDRLKQRDPGDKTRDIQADIVKDLDELIKQQKQQQQNQQQQSSQQKMGGGSETGQTRQSKGGGGQKTQPKGQKDGPPQTAQGPKNGGQPNKSQPKSGNPSEKKDGTGKEKAGQMNAKSGGDKSADKKAADAAADLFRDVWGHLPLTQRQEMDAYSRDRMMPRYREQIEQYYRSLAEQNRRKGE
jgi:hypothetical protein